MFSQYQVIGDAARLAQVVRTLIQNALSYTPNNGTIELTGKDYLVKFIVFEFK